MIGEVKKLSRPPSPISGREDAFPAPQDISFLLANTLPQNADKLNRSKETGAKTPHKKGEEE